MLIIGDIHLGLNINYKNLTNLNLTDLYSQTNLEFLEEIIKNYPDEDIVFLGDIFDKPKVEPRFLIAFKELLDKIKNSKVYLLTGNHDLKSKDDNILQIFKSENVIVIDELTEIDNFLFIPYEPMHELIDKFENKDVSDKVIFSHIDIGYNLSFCIEPKEVFDDHNLIFNGHIHKPYRKGKFINVGSVSSTDFSDTEFHSVIRFIDGNIEVILNDKIKFFDIKDKFQLSDLYKSLEALTEAKIFLRYNMELETYIFNCIESFSNIVAIQPSIEKNESIMNKDIDYQKVNREFKDIETLFKEYMLEKYNLKINLDK